MERLGGADLNVGGIAVLVLVICAGVFGLILVMARSNMDAPVDSYGNTTGLQENLTRDNVTATGPIATTLGGAIALIAGALFVFAVIVYFATGGRKHQSRY